MFNPSKNKSYTYDTLHRLTVTTGQWGTISYTYDPVGNRTLETTGAGSTTYSYAADTNKLLSASGVKMYNFGYDNNGNTTVENNRQYIYNYNQRLSRFTENGITKGEYVYNAKGQRVKKTVDGQTTVYNYDQNAMLIMESTGSGTITAEYAYLNGQPLAKIENNNVYYYHNDQLGSPMLMTDSSGAVVWQGEYLPFGEPYSLTNTVTNNFRFPGQYYDEETGLHYNYYRDYKPEVGRYMEADPIGLEGGVNLYAYVGNNPVNLIDPFGLAVGDWWDIPANFTRAYKISVEERANRPTAHNTSEDAMRHAEWNRRMVEETNSFTAWISGVGHEIDNFINGQPWSEGMMDLYNNAVGRAAGRAGVPVDPSKLQVSPNNSPSLNSYPGGGCRK
ncbi:MAG: RHS repeat-associated core domain-containing protein [Nitrospirota bacterium]